MRERYGMTTSQELQESMDKRDRSHTTGTENKGEENTSRICGRNPRAHQLVRNYVDVFASSDASPALLELVL